MTRGRRRLSGTIVLIGAVMAAGSLHTVTAAQAATPADDAVRPVIVELTGQPALRSATAGLAAARASVSAAQGDVVDRARQAGVRIQGQRSLTTLVNAVALRVPDRDVARLRSLPGVRAVHPDNPVRASVDTSVPLIGAPQVWQRTDPAGQSARGCGVTVAVVDSGVGYTHPSLGGGFGPGRKVVAGHDFVDGDDDPMDGNAHGTHVAGIIAGDGTGPGGVTGVAPCATLTAYRVLDDYGAGFESDVIAGLEAAVDPANPHRADVVNLSLSTDGDGSDPLGRAASAAAASGVVVVAAAGNSGPGVATVTSPAAADGVLAVGASTSGVRLPSAFLAGPGPRRALQTYRVPLSANPPAAPVTAEVVDVGEGTPDDYAKAGDVHGKIVMYTGNLPRSADDVSADDIARAKDAEDRGALAVLGHGYGSSPTVAAEPGVVAASPRSLASGDSQRMDRVVVLGMDGAQYAELTAAAAQGPLRVTIEGTDVTDQIARFSSRGPTAGRYRLKPDLVAPGVEIRSSVPKALWEPGEYRFSGTSMAAPHAAGAAALIRQLRPGLAARDVDAALIGAATPIAGVGPTTQGAGRLDVRAAADAVLTADPPTLSLGLADLGESTVHGSAKVVLRNTSTAAVTARLRADRAPGSPGKATVSPGTVRIPAGKTVTATVTVTSAVPATDADLAGWVTADVAGPGPDLRVAYLLAARPLLVQASPDPSDGTSTAFVYTPVPLSRPPTVTARGPHGTTVRVTARLDHGSWYRADLRLRRAGGYKLTAGARTTTGGGLVGAGAVEVTPPDSRGRWASIGPNAESGRLDTSPTKPTVGAMTIPYDVKPWITADKGRTWTHAGPLPIAAASNGTVVIDPRDANRIWYAVNSAGMDPTYQGKVLRSTDRGRTWTTLRFPDVPVHALTRDPAGRVLAAVSTDAVLVSRDGGDTWTSYPAGWNTAPSSAAIAGGDLYVGTSRAVWVVRGVGASPARAERVFAGSSLMSIAADDDLVVTVDLHGVVTGSRDRGRTWQTLATAPRRVALSVTLLGGTVYVASTDGDYVGRDHGRTWSVLPHQVRGPVTVDFDRWADDPGTLLLSAEQAGLYATTDTGATYRRIGVPGLTALDIAVTRDASGKPALLAGTQSGVYRTPLPTGAVTPATAEWGASGFEGYVGVQVPLIQPTAADPAVVWRTRMQATGTISIERSTDGAKTWSTVGRVAGTPHALLVHPADPNWVAVSFHNLGSTGLYTTRDGGKTWKTRYQPDIIQTVTADRTRPGRLWLGAASGLYRSDNGGDTTVKVADGRVTAIGFDPRRPNRLVVGGDTIRVSTDGGATFTAADTGGLPIRVSDIVAAPGSADTLYAATTGYTAQSLVVGGRGVLRSRDGGRSWASVSSGLQDTAVTSLAVSPDGKWLYAGVVNGGVQRRPLS